MDKIMFRNTLVILTGFIGTAFGQDPLAAIQQKLVSEYALTQPTADYTDIVTAGAVLTLKKGTIVMPPASNGDVCRNTYKNGQIKSSVLCRPIGWPVTTNSTNRRFVPGEKVWVIKIDVRDEGILFDLLSDPFSDVRYKAALKFPFPKGSIPSVDEAEKLVAEVFSARPPDNANNQSQQQSGPAQGPPAAPAQPTPAPAPPPPIAPPPPPADQPPATVTLGMTPDQVTANLGQPQKQVKLGTKLIYVYKDMKVTFVNNKVTDVQ